MQIISYTWVFENYGNCKLYPGFSNYGNYKLYPGFLKVNELCKLGWHLKNRDSRTK